MSRVLLRLDMSIRLFSDAHKIHMDMADQTRGYITRHGQKLFGLPSHPCTPECHQPWPGISNRAHVLVAMVSNNATPPRHNRATHYFEKKQKRILAPDSMWTDVFFLPLLFSF